MEKEALKTLLKSVVENEGYELVEFSIKNDKEGTILSLVVDKDTPTDMDALVSLNEKISASLDEIDPFDHPYSLDLSTLGAEKPLKVEKLHLYIGEYVNVHIINPIQGLNEYEGTIKAVEDKVIALEYKEKTRVKSVNIPFDNISKIRLAIKF